MNVLNTGGRIDMFHVQQDNIISGIFIKQVLEDSPAGRNGTLKTGDRILEVSLSNICWYCSFKTWFSDNRSKIVAL